MYRYTYGKDNHNIPLPLHNNSKIKSNLKPLERLMNHNILDFSGRNKSRCSLGQIHIRGSGSLNSQTPYDKKRLFCNQQSWLTFVLIFQPSHQIKRTRIPLPKNPIHSYNTDSCHNQRTIRIRNATSKFAKRTRPYDRPPYPSPIFREKRGSQSRRADSEDTDEYKCAQEELEVEEGFGGGTRALGSVGDGEGGGRRGRTSDFEVARHGEAAR